VARLAIPHALLDPTQGGFQLLMSWSPRGDKIGILWQSQSSMQSTEYHGYTVDLRSGVADAIGYRDRVDIDKSLAMPAGKPVPLWWNTLFWPPGWSKPAISKGLQ
jgi:hypothetical protein